MSAGNGCRKNVADPRYEGASKRSDHNSLILPSLASQAGWQLLHAHLEQIIHAGGNVLHRVGDQVDVVSALSGRKHKVGSAAISVADGGAPGRVIASVLGRAISPAVELPHV